MVRKKDPFWDYGVAMNNKFKCNFCEKVYSGGITRLKFHLSGLKGNDVDICLHVSDDVRTQAYMAVGNKSKRVRVDDENFASSYSSQGDPTSFDFPGMSNNHSSSMGKGMHQTTIPHMLKKMDKSDVDKILAKFFVLNNIPFNVVQTQSFIDVVKAFCDFGPTYRLPSYSNLRTKLIPEAKKEVDEYVEKVKKSWEKTGRTIMSDTWSDMKQRCFINFVAHSPGGAVFLQSVEISKERKTGLLLKDLCAKAIDSVGAQNVVQLVTDNASNYDSAGDMLIGKYPTMYKTKCAAHGIQLFFKDLYNEVEWLKCVFDDAKSIQSYMYRHQIVTALMREATNGKELKKPSTTRFASNFLVVQSILDVENELRMLVASPPWRDLDYSKTNEGKRITLIIQSHEFWSEAKDLIKVLEPFVRILRLVDGDGSTFGYLYQAMDMGRDSIEFKASMDEGKYGHIKTLLKKRRDDNIITPMHAAAAFFNPAYKTSPSFNESREMKDGISYMYDNLVADDEKQDFLDQMHLYRMEYASLFTPSAIAMLKTVHPRIWWDFCGDVLPILQKYAVRILSQPCSSSSCERNWSAFEAAQTKKRNRLTPNMLGTLVYVRMNSMMMEKFHTKELEDMKPINLDDLKDWPDYEEDLESNINDEINSQDEVNNLQFVCLTIDDDDDDMNNDLGSFAQDGGGRSSNYFQNLLHGFSTRASY